MNYLLSDQNTWVWFYFIMYALTIIFLVPTAKKSNIQPVSVEVSDEKRALQFASQLILRTILIVPMLFLIKNTI